MFIVLIFWVLSHARFLITILMTPFENIQWKLVRYNELKKYFMDPKQTHSTGYDMFRIKLSVKLALSLFLYIFKLRICFYDTFQHFLTTISFNTFEHF